MTPRVTLEGDVQLDLTVDDTSFGGNVSIAGQDYPQFTQRTVTTRLRLRDGESNLLAGLLQQNASHDNVQGFPGAIHVPLLKQLFSANSISTTQDDIVMLLTPHIVRGNGITEADLRPLYIGSQGVAGATLGVGGPPPLINAPPDTPPAAPSAAADSGGRPPRRAASPSRRLPGTSPVPGMVVVPTPTPTPTPSPTPSPAPNARRRR